jgi:hypothetical protein
VLGQPRTTQRDPPQISDEEERLTKRIVELATQYGRYGYRRITALLKRESWKVNHKRVERIWRQQGLKVPQKQPKRGRLWLNDGSCIRLRPEHKDHVWSYDFVTAKTSGGRSFRILTILDEYTRECLATEVKRHFRAEDVIDQLFQIIILRGVIPHPIRQWAGVHGEGGEEMAGSAWGENVVHRAWEPLGEWLHRVLQWETAGRAAEPGDLHDFGGGQGADWMVAEGVQ